MDGLGSSSAPIEELNRLLAGRYRVERVLGEEAQGTTYLATSADGRQVVLQELAVADREGFGGGVGSADEERFSLPDGWGGEIVFGVRACGEGLVASRELAPLRREFLGVLQKRAASRGRRVGRAVAVSRPSERVTQRAGGGAGALVGAIVVGAIALSLVFGTNCGRFAARMSGYDEVVFGPLQSCELAREALGDAIGVAMVGCQMGATHTSVGSGVADWEMPVSGSAGRGRYAFVSIKEDGIWALREGTLRVGERAIDVVRCSEVEGP